MSMTGFVFFSHSFSTDYRLTYKYMCYLSRVMSDNVTNDENAKKTVGFKVSPSEYAVFQQYAQLFHNQMIEDPNTKQPRRLLEGPRPEIGLLIRNATYGYLVQYQYMMQAQAQQAKQQQEQVKQQ